VNLTISWTPAHTGADNPVAKDYNMANTLAKRLR